MLGGPPPSTRRARGGARPLQRMLRSRLAGSVAFLLVHMASRGRRGGVPTRDGEQRRDEPRREDQGEQLVPAPQGPVLPPPPPVDYGVFMQGLVQTMQTQAHTQAALQAQLEAQQAQVPVPQAQDHGGPSIMERRVRWSSTSRRRRLRRRGLQLLSSGRIRRRQCTSHRSAQWQPTVLRYLLSIPLV
ncbi:hypothetical protein Taro_021392 [Colocasia esculenta]|uniref:Uncharacterized protein n=1 Tax=Colocasia esculenta TaxID=4460 RepID=A0A843V816_COLES|nr:hypothetical protein [Colocasia esculenta]